MSAGRPFFDTKVLLYLISAGAKAEKAETLLNVGGVVSVQVFGPVKVNRQGRREESPGRWARRERGA